MQAGTVSVLPDGAALIHCCRLVEQSGGGGGVVFGRTASGPAPANLATSPHRSVTTKLTMNGSASRVCLTVNVQVVTPAGSVTVDGTACGVDPTCTVALVIAPNRTRTS